MSTPYKLLGGEEGVKALSDRFYDIMDTHPEYEPIRKLHPEDLSSSRRKFFMFLSGWLGGPDLYVQERGHPMLRRRHLPFKITAIERDLWMDCMQQALKKTEAPEAFKAELTASFQRTADHMQNAN